MTEVAASKKFALLATGGTIGTKAKNPDDVDYGSVGHGEYVTIDQLRKDTGIDEVARELDVVIQHQELGPIDSTAVTSEIWSDIGKKCETLLSPKEDIKAIIITHGTASLEETAFALSMVLKPNIPVIITGSMSPLNGTSSDAPANLIAAFRVAAYMCKHEYEGVLVVMNNEIHLPRFVTKTHTHNHDAFKSPNFKPIGRITEGEVEFDKQMQSKLPANLGFTVPMLANSPRVDIVCSYVGADSVGINAYVKAGARGIISMGFAPGLGTPAEKDGLDVAVKGGCVVVQSVRVLSGNITDSEDHKKIGIIAGNNLSPWIARIVVQLAISKSDETKENVKDILCEAFKKLSLQS
ncbi:asparaginase [Colletotrichum scovillei]|uniref:asparaginase n=1 Tax=Colletotrichum scovillei TaxID=1209932 RepID=A0A9P7R0I7_9PEZI|nr:asparaginase [Colletotrichum scovillei]KAF4780954.1 asparaginase [Colletotrichum scovillei]KAG7045003.1 asparaginase [Colletotrichum scovillei]KAG7052167.1 asparaginase [Colletotrichum scovillei]KAG7064456.1 asparaginase [Colletotrichum scovillei]